MPRENQGKFDRRKVLTSIATAGSFGIIATPVSAEQEDDWKGRNESNGRKNRHDIAERKSNGRKKGPKEYKRGPVTSTPHSDDHLTYDEFKEVLESSDNGSVEVNNSNVRNKRIYIGDDRNVTIEEMEERFSDENPISITSADSGTWEADCRTIPYINTEVCTEVTFDVYTWGIDVDVILYDYPVWGGGIGYRDQAADFSINIPGLPLRGDGEIGASQIGGCDAELEVEIDLEVWGRNAGSFDESKVVNYC